MAGFRKPEVLHRRTPGRAGSAPHESNLDNTHAQASCNANFEHQICKAFFISFPGEYEIFLAKLTKCVMELYSLII